MKLKLFNGIAAGTMLIATMFTACNNGGPIKVETRNWDENTQGASADSPDSLIKRGEYLVSVIGCDDCHSPKRMGKNGPELIPELRLSGYHSGKEAGGPDKKVIGQGWLLFQGDLTSAVGPWGRSFSANLTSDATGIGNWTEEQFNTVLDQGLYKGLPGSRPLLPPMPWQMYKHLSPQDRKAIFAFLKSTRPVENIVPPPIPLEKL